MNTDTQNWVCQWCEYMNAPASLVCEVCAEKSSVHATTLYPKPAVFQLESQPLPPPAKATKPESEDSKHSPTIPEQKSYNPPPSHSLRPKEEPHVCFRDEHELYCLICQKPMLFLFARDIEFPSGFPEPLLDKAFLLEKVLTQEKRMEIIERLNGGPIAGSESHTASIDETNLDYVATDGAMNIAIIIGTTVSYAGPSRDAMAKIFSAAVKREKPMVLTLNSKNMMKNDNEDGFVVLFPTGRVHLLSHTLKMKDPLEIEVKLRTMFGGIKIEESEKMLFVVPHMFWSRKCPEPSTTYKNFADAPLWSNATALTFISMISVGLSIPDIIALLSSNDKQVLSHLLGYAIERIIAVVHNDEATKLM